MKPASPKLWEDESSFSLKEDSPDHWWFAYPVFVIPQKSYKREIFIAECALTEIIEEILIFLTTPNDDMHNTDLSHSERGLELYMRLTGWKYSLPDCLQVSSIAIPSALILQ
jgi:hypothetical protein